jgi:hypothetical protein
MNPPLEPSALQVVENGGTDYIIREIGEGLCLCPTCTKIVIDLHNRVFCGKVDSIISLDTGEPER